MQDYRTEIMENQAEEDAVLKASKLINWYKSTSVDVAGCGVQGEDLPDDRQPTNDKRRNI